MQNERMNNQRKPATSRASSITAETRVKDFVSPGLLEDIRSLQAIHDRLAKYEEEKKADETTWDGFVEDANSAQDNIMGAVYDMSSIAGRELEYKIMNP